MNKKYEPKCGMTGCQNKVIDDCYYCGIPLCEDHSKKLGAGKKTEIYCTPCFSYLAVSGLNERELERRLIPNVLLVNSRKCTGCRTCQFVCSFEHFNEFSYEKSAVDLKKDEEFCRTDIVVCRHCEHPKCVQVCPAGALSKNEYSGYVHLDVDTCNQCMLCVEACPYNAIFASKDGTILKCDLCGGDPMCVKYCPAQAIEWIKKYQIGVRKNLTYVTSSEQEVY